MPNKRKSLKNQREAAYHSQNGKCFYCNFPIWIDSVENFANQYGISIRRAMQFQCTGEHLLPHCKGGSSERENIVAACKFCNVSRHRRKKELPPDKYKSLVRRQVHRGAWNSGYINPSHFPSPENALAWHSLHS